jgi:GTP pyrophosphokinase
MGDLEQDLRSIALAPYIVKAMALIGVSGKAGINAFRHQMYTMSILLDYKFSDAVLLKASVVHDLFEDALGLPGVSRAEIERIDSDGPAVYALVMEVTIRTSNGVREPKPEYLTRVLESGSSRAKILKVADRISNVTFLGFVHDLAFVRRYLDETKTYILPHVKGINLDMFRELSDLIADREARLRLVDANV